ncbi:MAG TPA: sulfatase-like hydrolase/transferase [Candidatus Limnocylindrales bacterium]|nr:sulfatase-like hydrolase/transferase [Candidatus Limnocylindrales bacterium]
MKLNHLFILLAALLQISVAALAAPVARRASIIFIQCHGLGYGDLSCYGQTNFQTPNLDRLAAEGIRFTGYYAGNAGSSPVPSALLFGKNSAAAIAPNEINLAQRLRQAGYHTGLIGEWGLSGEPWTRGFDEFAGFLNFDEGKNYYADYLWRYAQNSILDMTNNRMTAFVGKEMLYPNTGGKKEQYLPDLFMTAAANFIRVNQPDQFNNYRPFFLLVNLPAPRTAATGADDFPVPTDAPFTGEQWPPAAKNRAALITRLDSGIGQVLEQLNKLNLTNNVAIFFTSAAPPEKFANTNLNFLRPNGNLRGKLELSLPMIVHWPKTIPAGQASDFAWAAWDFAPTALEIAQVRPATNFTGVSILPRLLGRTRTNQPASKP